MSDYDYKEGQVKEVKLGPLKFNPVVSGLSALLLYGFVVACALEPDVMLHHMSYIKALIPETASWLYIVSQDIWVVALIYVMIIPKYGSLKLGKDDEKPEYSDMTWFSMLFAAGVATGFFFFSAEPMWHEQGWGGARFTSGSKGYGTRNEDAIHAMMLTWYHWGVHGWIPYTTVGAVLGIMCYRRGYPMTIRYCFVPLIGQHVYGWMGDLIDVLSIVTTIAGVCTSLGLGAMSINRGVGRLDQGFFRGEMTKMPYEPKYMSPGCEADGAYCLEGQEAYGVQYNITNKILIILVITLLATVSVVTGINRGIVNTSRFTFGLGMVLTTYVWFSGATWHALNVMVQTLGYYFFYFFKVSFQTDAYELLGGKDLGLGGAPDGLSGGAGWMDAWTIFYWGWWISWGPFVGTFLARISKGRTLRQFILGTLIIPSLYCFWWFGVYGSEQIRMQRKADVIGLCGASGCDAWLVEQPYVKADCDACLAGLRDVFGDASAACDECDRKIAEQRAACAACDQTEVLGVPGVDEIAEQRACGTCDPDMHHAILRTAGTCGQYSGSFSEMYKRRNGMGYNNGCQMKDEDHTDWETGRGYGVCKQYQWKRPVIWGNECVEMTSWVNYPCDGGADPTAFSTSAYAAKASAYKPGEDPIWQNGFCKDKLTEDMFWGSKRIFNVFSADAESNYDKDKTSATYGSCVGADCISGANSFHTQQTCFQPATNSEICVWWQGTEDAFFDTVSAYGGEGLASFMSAIGLIAITLYFVTSSDSGSYVVDMISANGDQDPPTAQRVFWSVTEGVCAAALLYAGKNTSGGQGALRALQSASIFMGLPFTFVLFWVSQSLLQLVKEETGEYDKNRKCFRGMIIALDHSKDGQGNLRTLKAIFMPGLIVGEIMQSEELTWPVFPAKVWGGLLQVLWFVSVVLSIFGLAQSGSLGEPAWNYNVCMFGGALFLGFAILLSLVRRGFREGRGIKRGDFITDLICALILYPCCIGQMDSERLLPNVAKGEQLENVAGAEAQASTAGSADLKPLVKELVAAELRERFPTPAELSC